ncbi:MAG TPA: glycosyltransferase family 39 protein [Vicinamibacteria bacterium]|nr:glycosyltransferase family 39 protein [Vicinamibacteria bacterium]
MRAVAVAILAPLLLAAAVRLPRLGGPSLTPAEQAAFVESEGFSTVAVIPDGRVLDADGLPRRSGPKPLDAAGLAFWTRLAGASEGALRLPAALAGVLTAALVALVAFRPAGPRAAAWAGALVALSPIHALVGRRTAAAPGTGRCWWAVRRCPSSSESHSPRPSAE